MSAEVRFRVRRGVRLSGLVDGDDPELVPLSLAKSGHAGLQVVDRRVAVLVVGDEGVKPAAKLVLLLNDVVRDRPAAVVLRLVPLQGHGLVVEVCDLGLSWLARWS